MVDLPQRLIPDHLRITYDSGNRRSELVRYDAKKFRSCPAGLFKFYCLLLGLLVELGIIDDYGRLASERRKKLNLFFAKVDFLLRVENYNPDGLALNDQGDPQIRDQALSAKKLRVPYSGVSLDVADY